MSRHRISPEAGWCNQSKLPKGPNGRNLCRQCGDEVPKGRQTFCSQACVDAWSVKTNPGHARRLVFKRDRGVCAVCGLDTEALVRELKRLRREARKRMGYRDDHSSYYGRFYADTPFGQMVERLQLPRHLRDLDRSFWEMDHTIPVVEGGGECGLDNLRTLCWACHARATRQLRGRRARHQQLELVFRS